jgi:hypothetical protein
MTDYFGLTDTRPIVELTDIVELAWRRYDAIATAEDAAWAKWIARDKNFTIEAAHLLQCAEEAQDHTLAAREDKNHLTKRGCTCRDHPDAPRCACCCAYARVRAWERDQ